MFTALRALVAPALAVVALLGCSARRVPSPESALDLSPSLRTEPVVAASTPGARTDASFDYGDALFPAPSSAPQAEPAAEAPRVAEEGEATWSQGADERGSIWVRSHGGRAPDLVIRGTTTPTNPDYMYNGQREAVTIRLKTEGWIPRLHIWAKADGPAEVDVDGMTVDASEDAFAIDLAHQWKSVPGGGSERRAGLEGEISVAIRDVDRPGQRRGQSSSYVIVVSEDFVSTRTEQPEARLARAANEITVRWDLITVKCPEGTWQSSCYAATLVLGTGARAELPKLVSAQADCYPDGAGMLCAGASGSIRYAFDVGADGKVALMTHSYSDGACEVADCGTHVAILRFQIPSGARLVPDPAGTFPALPALAGP